MRFLCFFSAIRAARALPAHRPVSRPARAAPAATCPRLREIIVSPDRTIDGGTIVFRDGVIVAVGDKVTLPADAQVHDAKGKTLYAGFIDAYSELPADASRAVANDKSGAAYWNANVTPQVAASAIYAADAEANRKYRSQGVAVRLVAPSAGIIKGQLASDHGRRRRGRDDPQGARRAAREADHGSRRWWRISQLANGGLHARAAGLLRCRLVRAGAARVRRESGFAAPRGAAMRCRCRAASWGASSR